jgi:hypothetical protein
MDKLTNDWVDDEIRHLSNKIRSLKLQQSKETEGKFELSFTWTVDAEDLWPDGLGPSSPTEDDVMNLFDHYLELHDGDHAYVMGELYLDGVQVTSGVKEV